MSDFLPDIVLGDLDSLDDEIVYAQVPKGEQFPVPRIPKTLKFFLNKTTVMYGGTGTGKTILTLDLMRLMHKCFPIVFVFSTTELENKTFAPFVPNPLIYDKVSVDALKDIYELQKLRSQTYEAANDIEILEQLFRKVANSKQVEMARKIQNLCDMATKRADTYYKSNADRKEKKKEIKKNAENALRRVFKAIIGNNIKKLRNLIKSLTPQQRYCVKFFGFNPNMLIVFDDCASDIKSIASKKANTFLTDFFFKGRHSHMTFLYTMQDDTCLLSDLRKNVHNSVFCSQRTANSFFGRATNGVSTVDKKRYIAAASVIFNEHNQEDYKRLVYTILDPKSPIQYITGDSYDDFRMCGNIVWKFCGAAKKQTEQLVDETNKFYERFQAL